MAFGSGFSSGFSAGFGNPSLELVLEVDWDNDGSYSLDEDLISYVRSIDCRRGKDRSSMVVGRSIAGQLMARLNNFEGQFSPFESSSPLYGMLLPGRRVRLRAVTPWSQVLWTGVLDSAPRPYVTAQTAPEAALSAAGVLYLLAGENSKVSPHSLTGVRSGDVIGAILDAAGFPAADRQIEQGDVEIFRWFEDDIEALVAMRRVEDTEGGFIYEGIDNDIVFESRYSRDVNQTASLATFSDDPGASLHYRAIEEDDPLRELFNVVQAEVQPYETGESQVLWSLNQPIVLAAGASRTYTVSVGSIDGQSIAHVEEWGIFDVTRDDTVSNGFPIDNDADETVEDLGDIEITIVQSARSLEITYSNIDVIEHTITDASVEGVPVLEEDSYKVTARDQTSIDTYTRRTFPRSGPWYGNEPYAQNSADYTLAKTKDPHPVMSILILGRDAAHLEQMFKRQISDRITLVADGRAKLGVSADFYIDTITFHFEAGRVPECHWELAPVLDLFDGESLFTLDVSELDGDDVLPW